MTVQTPTLQELLEAGVHFGHQTRRGNPRMKQFIYGAREGVHIIDLTKSEEYLKKAAEYAYELGKQGKILLIVGTKKQARPIVEELANKANAYYLSQRWIGGFLTNFEEISKNIKKLKSLQEQKTKGELSKYTKKEQLLIDRKIIKLDKDFKGVMNLTEVPDVLFIIDIVSESTAVLEAIRKQLKIIAITDTNSNPTLVDFPIPGNDDAVKSIRILTETVMNAYVEGSKQSEKGDEGKPEKSQDSKKADIAEEIKLESLSPEVAVVEELIEKKTIKESERVV